MLLQAVIGARHICIGSFDLAIAP
jgi:hypothetical protein